jgi:hypothetical protein
MQRVQTFTCLIPPDFSSTQRIFCRFGCHTFACLLFAWLTLFPRNDFFPHTSHTLDIAALLVELLRRFKSSGQEMQAFFNR